MLFLHELEQVLVLVKQFTSASSIKTFLSNRYYSDTTFSTNLMFGRYGLPDKVCENTQSTL